jgi:hypothetical protein
MYFERKNSRNAYFITLTYDEQNIPRNPDTGFATTAKEDIQSFLREVRLSCRIWDSTTKKLRYNSPRWFVVSEYGPKTERPHYHAMVFNLPESWGNQKAIAKKLRGFWKKGHVKVSACNNKRIMYVAKYQITKSMLDYVSTEREAPFKVCTKRGGGIGNCLLKDASMVSYLRSSLSTTIRRDGRNVRIPKYYMQRIGYSVAEKVELYGKMEREMESAVASAIERIRKSGYVDPYAELRNREAEWERRYMKQLMKIVVL